jgi:hypothetical protein
MTTTGSADGDHDQVSDQGRVDLGDRRVSPGAVPESYLNAFVSRATHAVALRFPKCPVVPPGTFENDLVYTTKQEKSRQARFAGNAFLRRENAASAAREVSAGLTF